VTFFDPYRSRVDSYGQVVHLNVVQSDLRNISSPFLSTLNEGSFVTLIVPCYFLARGIGKESIFPPEL